MNNVDLTIKITSKDAGAARSSGMDNISYPLLHIVLHSFPHLMQKDVG